MIISRHQANCCHTQKLKRLIPRQSWHLAILAIVCRVCELSFLSLFLSVSSFVNWKLVSCCGLSHPARLLSLLMHCWRLWPNCWHMLRMFEFCSFPSAFHLSIYACSIVVPQNFHHTREHKLHTQTHTHIANHIIYRLSLAHSAGRKVSQRRQRVVWVIYASKSCSLRCIAFIYHLSAAAVAQQQESRVDS